jgi:hypothetical protein
MKNKPKNTVVSQPEGIADFLFNAMKIEHSAQKLSRKFTKTEWINAMTKALQAQTA